METESKASKKMGRPKKYQGIDGAPTLATRIDPLVYEHIKSRPEGVRCYVERLVTDDIERTKPAEPVKSTSPGDVPGQLLLSDGEP